MDTTEILALYERHERREASYPLWRREAGPHTVRMLAEDGGDACVLWSGLPEAGLEGAIDAELAYFAQGGRSFEWKVFSHDRPADLADRLGARGLEVGEGEAVMALELEGASLPSAMAPRGIAVRRLESPGQLADYRRLEEEVWGSDHGAFVASLAACMEAAPAYQSFYVAYEEERPVSAARITFSENSPFAGLWGGSTLESHRGRGIYTAILGARLAEARARGYAFATIDALPMSRPIVAKRGFRLLAMSHPCTWEATA